MFPGPGAQIYHNDAGEVMGWDYPADPEFDDDWDPDRDMPDIEWCERCDEPLEDCRCP